MSQNLMPDGVKMKAMLNTAIKQSPGVSITILVAPFFDAGIANYVSNSNRQDMIAMLRETADRLEKGEDFKTPNQN